MKYVLVDSDGDFYAGEYQDKFWHTRQQISDNIGEAKVFEIKIVDGVIQSCPELPTGQWFPKQVKVTVEGGS